MWFLNKLTGCKFDIYDKYHQERLMNDNNYELIEEKPFVIDEESKILDNEQFETADTCPVDYNKLSYQELQKIAKAKGLKYTGISKENLIKSLEEVGEEYANR